MRFGTRLFLLFLLSGAIPVVLLVGAGWLQFRQQLRFWTLPSLEQALDASLSTNRSTLDRVRRNLEEIGQSLLPEAALFPPEREGPAVPEETMAQRARLMVERALVHPSVDLAFYAELDSTGWRIRETAGVDSALVPDPATLIRQPRVAEVGPQPTPPLRLEDGGTDVFAIPTFLWSYDGETESARLIGCLALGTALGPSFFEQLGTASEGLGFYRRFLDLGRVLRNAYLVLLGLALVVALGFSLWLARRVARSVSRPVERLVDAMEAVGRGREVDLDIHSRIPEMETLAGAFSHMRTTLSEYETQLREIEQVRGARQTARFVAHEIRNTLTPVNAGIAVLEKRVQSLSEENRQSGLRALGVIRREADRMAALAQSFSDYAHLPEPKPEWVEMGPLLASLGSAVPEGVQFELREESPLPPLHVDPDEMERLLRNLVKNAVEAMEGRGRITVTAGLSPEGAEVRIGVEDDGPGMDARTLAQATQVGFTTKETGTGLGLALVRRSLSHYGGNLLLESEPGRGTRALVTLPVRPARTGGDSR